MIRLCEIVPVFNGESTTAAAIYDPIFYPYLLNRAARRMANRWPERYERRWTRLFLAWFICFELEVVKGQLMEAGRSPSR